MKNITIPPLDLKEIFDPLLLSAPHPKFRDDEDDILQILNYVKKKLWKKLNKCPSKKIKCENIEKEIREVYEQIKKKKKLQETAKNFTQRPFYYFNCVKRSHNEILHRYKHKSRTIFATLRETNDIQEEQ